MIKAVIFDLDDTLISEREYVISGYRHIARRLSDRVGEDKQAIFDILMELFQTSPKNVFDRLLDKLQVPHTKDDILELVEAYRKHEPDIKFYDDVLTCLEQLKEKGIKTGIITDGYTSTQRNKLKVLNAHRYFEYIIVTDELGRDYWKPNPRVFEIMRYSMGVGFDEMVYVGDNPEKDFYISSIYPIKTVRIAREYSEHEHTYRDKGYLDGIKPDYIITSLEGLLALASEGRYLPKV